MADKDRVKQLEQDNARLRAALERILEIARRPAPGDSGAAWRALGEIEEWARRALADDAG